MFVRILLTKIIKHFAFQWMYSKKKRKNAEFYYFSFWSAFIPSNISLSNLSTLINSLTENKGGKREREKEREGKKNRRWGIDKKLSSFFFFLEKKFYLIFFKTIKRMKEKKVSAKKNWNYFLFFLFLCV